MLGRITHWLLGDEKDFATAMKTHPYRTGGKSLLVLIIIGFGILAGAWLLYLFGPPSGQVVYTPFRNTQSVKNWVDFRIENVIHLDTAGNLTPVYPSNTNPRAGIEMTLNSPRLVFLDGKGGGSGSFWVNGEGIIFDTYKTPSHHIKLGNKSFLVTLRYINPSNLTDGSGFEYVFDVYEE